MDEFNFGSNDFGDYTSSSKTLRNITWAATPETLAKVAMGIRFRYLKLYKTKEEIIQTQIRAGGKILRSYSRFFKGKPLTEVIDNELKKVMKYAEAVDNKYVKIAAVFFQKQIKQIKKNSFVDQTVNDFFEQMKSKNGLVNWLKLDVKDSTNLEKQLNDTKITIAKAYPGLIPEIETEDADVREDIKMSQADMGGGLSGSFKLPGMNKPPVPPRSGGYFTGSAQTPVRISKVPDELAKLGYRINNGILVFPNGQPVVSGFGRRRRRGSKRKSVSGRRRRSGRRGNPQAAEAMRLMRSEGISLKDAWAQVKGGSNRRRRTSRKGSRRRLRGVLKSRRGSRRGSKRAYKRGRKRKSRKIVAFVDA